MEEKSVEELLAEIKELESTIEEAKPLKTTLKRTTSHYKIPRKPLKPEEQMKFNRFLHSTKEYSKDNTVTYITCVNSLVKDIDYTPKRIGTPLSEIDTSKFMEVYGNK